MARIGILTCSNATQDLGCSSVSCLADFRKREGTFAEYPEDEKLTLVGIINCPGCPTLTGPDKLPQRIRALTEFKVDTIHFTEGFLDSGEYNANKKPNRHIAVRNYR